MAKPVLFDFNAATILQIVNAILNKKTNSASFHIFRTRNCGLSAAAHQFDNGISIPNMGKMLTEY